MLPSVDEAFGVAYVEAMAGGVPGDRLPRRARPGGDRALRRAGCGSSPPGDPEALAGELDALLADDARRRELGAAARATVAGALHLGAAAARATVAAYEAALR